MTHPRAWVPGSLLPSHPKPGHQLQGVGCGVRPDLTALSSSLLPLHCDTSWSMARNATGAPPVSPPKGGPDPLPSPWAGAGGRTKTKPQDQTKCSKTGSSHTSPGQSRGNAASESRSWSLPSSIFMQALKKKNKAAEPCPSCPRPSYWLAQAGSCTGSCLRDLPRCNPARVGCEGSILTPGFAPPALKTAGDRQDQPASTFSCPGRLRSF